MFVHTESRSLLLRVKRPEIITSILPKWRTVDYDGHNIAVPHRDDVVRVLRNLGIKAPPPILHYYDWPIQAGRVPFKHQLETAAFATLYPRCFILNDPGTAKTVPILWAADWLMRQKIIRKVLITAPLSTLNLVWADEIFGTLMHRRCAVLHGSKARRLELLSGDFDFYIVNHDGVSIIAPYLENRTDIDLVIVDECAEYRNASTDKYKTLVSAIGKRRLWMVTGTPCPKSPEDVWAQARLVNKQTVPQYASQWREETMLHVTTHKWIPKHGSYERAYEVLQPAIRFKKKDCLDLPPVLWEKREVDLSKEQIRAYTTMKNEMILMGDGATITAVNAADRIGKLRQILLGAVKVPEKEGEYIMLDHKPRLKVLLETISQAVAKVIVVVPFKGIIEALAKEVGEHYSVAVINGDVSKTQRDATFRAFKSEKNPHVLLCHPKVMAHGLNLTVADMTIFYGPCYSNNDVSQVIERFNRPGQVHKMTIVQLGASHMEWQIYKQVQDQSMSQSSMLDLYKNEVLGIQP
jgi:SNF2 family DNA or RNA helicase